jgi:myo-inositol-1(or 4)-monophosphatase
MSPNAPDWLGFSRRAAGGARAALERFPRVVQRAERIGRGEGGDMTLAIDKAVEDAVFDEIEALGAGVRVVSEERGEVEICGGGPALLVVDPIDGSLNAKRRLPPYSLSIAVASGDAMGDVEFAYVADLAGSQEWWASRGGGAFCDEVRLRCDDAPRLEILGIESANPRTVGDRAPMLAATGADRLRIVGSIALALCYVASARFDAMLSLRAARSVDAAAGQLIVRESGGAVAFPDAGEDPLGTPLGLEMRSRVVGAATAEMLERLLALGP